MKQMKRIATLILLKAGMRKVLKETEHFERIYSNFTALRQQHNSAPNCRLFLFKFYWSSPHPHSKICVVRNYNFSVPFCTCTVKIHEIKRG